MARTARIYTDSEIYHVIMRGNNQQNLFYTKKDRIFFIERIKKYADELNIEIYSYCLMSNHVHLLLGKANAGLSKFIQKIANSYVYYFNRKYERTGHLFQGRFKSEPIDDSEYFKKVFRYILRNPEKARISRYSSYQWSSYKEFIEKKDNSVISLDFTVEVFGSYEQASNYLTADVSSDFCMEYENKYRMDDIHAAKIIKKVFQVRNLSGIGQLPLSRQIENTKALKQIGIPCNQIARITGIGRKIIYTA